SGAFLQHFEAQPVGLNKPGLQIRHPDVPDGRAATLSSGPQICTGAGDRRLSGSKASADHEPRFLETELRYAANRSGANGSVSFSDSVGTPITEYPPQSGRIEARTGLRMMPTSPRSPLSFRTAGFPQYGWKDGFGQRLPNASLSSSLLPAYADHVLV